MLVLTSFMVIATSLIAYSAFIKIPEQIEKSKSTSYFGEWYEFNYEDYFKFQNIEDWLDAGEMANECKNLGKNVEGVIKNLPKSSGLASGVLGTFIIGAVAIGAAAAILNAIAVPVVIKNRGCSTLYPTVYLPFKIPGLSLPDQPILNGESATAKVPPVTFTVNGSGNNINLQAFSMNLNFNLGEGASDLIFNGQSLLNTSTTVNLKSEAGHELIVSCN